MSRQKTVEAFYAAGTGGDVDALAAFFAGNAVWDNRIDGDPMGGLYEGIGAIRDGLLTPLFRFLPDGISTSIERLLETGDTVICMNTGRGTTFDGAPFEKRYAHIFDFDGDHIIRVTEFRS